MIVLNEFAQHDASPNATLTLPYDHRQKSRLRVRLDNGDEVAVTLARGTVLRHGDRLSAANGLVVAIKAAQERVSTAQTADPLLLLRAAYHLGNRHVAVQVGTGWLRYQADHVLDAMVEDLGLAVNQEQAPFEPEAGAYHHAASSQLSEPRLFEPQLSEEEHAKHHMPDVIPIGDRATPSLKPDSSLLRLLQLSSPTLPIGAYAYSQGLEYAVSQGWVVDEATALAWIKGVLTHAMRHLDVPVFARLYAAWQRDDVESVEYWSQWLLASREAAELQAEDRHLGTALARLLEALDIAGVTDWLDHDSATYATVFSLAAVRWEIGLGDAAGAYLWSWSENQVAAAIKLVPLGQTAGQRILLDLVGSIPAVVAHGLALKDEDIGFSSPGLAIASAMHEVQYTRLFRS